MRVIVVILMAMLCTMCKQKNTNLESDAAIKPNEFIKAFRPIEGNFFATDTNINSLADNVAINHNLLKQFVPDSLLKRLTSGDEKTVFHPIGRISKSNETYILFLTVKNKKPFVSTLVFDRENKFLAEKDLFSPLTDAEGYKYSLSINKEPTFFIMREKYFTDKEPVFTKTGWAFSGTNFIAVVNETNEKNSSAYAIINPIDTFAAKNKYSGTYVQNDRNYIAVRDGKTKQEYLFFLHIDKNDGTCVGELKGTMHMVDSFNATYNFAGDPCIIDFAFDRNIITIKEQGSCGNKRGMDCLFDDAYTKRKTNKPTTPVVAAPKLVVPNVPIIKPATTKQKAKPKPVATPKPAETNEYTN